jgi:hypothetical protein
LRIAFEGFHRVAHGGQIDHGGNAREILQQDTGGAIGNLGIGLAAILDPFRERFDVVDSNGRPERKNDLARTYMADFGSEQCDVTQCSIK